MSQVKNVLSVGAFLLLGVAFASATPALDLHLGHFETQIDYELTPGNPDAGWNFAVSYDTTNDFNTTEGIVRLDPATTRIVATPETEVTLSSPFEGLGVKGDTIWILPQANRLGQIFFGWRSVIPPGVFQFSSNGAFFPNPLGSIVVELVDVSGPAVDAGGLFAMWESQSLGGVEMHFNTADGIDANDRLGTVPIDGHTHYNYAMTMPGNYAVTFRASGRLNPWQPDGNQNTSSTGTFHFTVPFSSVAKGEAALRLSLDESPVPAAIHPFGETVEYAPGQVMLLTEATKINGTTRPYAFRVIPDTTNQTAAPHRVGISGNIPLAFPLGVTVGLNPLEVLSLSGPGALETIVDDQEQLYFAFSESGIYRVTVRAVGVEAGSMVKGLPFELVFLAGLEPDYDFSAYADSFERTHGLPAGSLKSDASDWDRDGVPDIVEYHLFWEGMDPAVTDSHKLPRPSPDDSERLIVFHRDTYKDRLNRNLENIVLEYSSDLSNWVGWSDRNHGWPLEQYETGAEIGNALGRIHRRTVRLPGSTPQGAFFRWTIDPAN